MTILHKAAQQALEALELAQTDVHWELNSPTRKFLRKAEKNLRAALAEPVEPVPQPGVWMHPWPPVKAQQDEPVEPVAWKLWDENPEGGGDWRYYDAKDFKEGIDPMKYFDGLVPLYGSDPPQRQPLTKERLLYIYNQLPNWGMDMDSLPQGLEKFARAIERAHGIGEQP